MRGSIIAAILVGFALGTGTVLNAVVAPHADPATGASGGTTGGSAGGGTTATGGGTPGTDVTGGGTCGVAPDSGGRHVSTVRVGSVVHMVWEQPVVPGGLPEICYANREDSPNFGLHNPSLVARRVTDTTYASVLPEIAVDPISGMLYVSWVELVREEEVTGHADYNLNAVRLAASDDAFLTVSTYPRDLVYIQGNVAKAAHGDTVGETLGGGDAHFQLDVRDSEVRFGDGLNGHRPPTGTPILIVDMDGDGIRDSWEVTGKLGFVTSWKRADTDADGIPDLWEIERGLDPTFDQTPICDKLRICDIIRRGILLYLDLDGDGLSAYAEGLGYPVTTEVAGFPTGGTATYRFWPKVAGNYSLLLRTQMRTYFAVGSCTSVSLTATLIGGGLIGTFTLPWADGPQPWTVQDAGALYLAQDAAADVRVNVTFDPPSCADSKVAILRLFALDWLKLELIGNRAELNYKDAGDFSTKAMLEVSVEDMTISLDPDQKDVLFELDSMAGHDFQWRVLEEVIDAFSDWNIIAHFKVDETDLPTGASTGVAGAGTVATLSFAWPPTSTDESSVYLAAHRNPALSAYVHVMNVHDIAGAGGIAEQSAPGDPAPLGGVLIADQWIIDNAPSNPTLLFERRLADFVHEVGHALGSHHEVPGATLIDPVIDPGGVDICNQYNVMGWTYCSLEDKALRGTGNTNRRFGATSTIGRPRWSIESVNLFNFGAQLSVQVGNNMAGMLTV